MLCELGVHFLLLNDFDIDLAKTKTAGVPVKRPVAGVAMGLILEPSGEFQILTDILGSEDAMGDMDFKVAGDEDNITAFQMDIKVTSLSTPKNTVHFPNLEASGR